jgi:hypothetical protein
MWNVLFDFTSAGKFVNVEAGAANVINLDGGLKRL